MSAITQAMPASERLLSRLEPQPNGCWHWTGFINDDGYGRVGYKGDRSVPVYRAVYDCFVGPIPEGMVLDHTCHTKDKTCMGGASCLHRRCGNPEHLEPVTSDENARRAAFKAFCVNGHSYTPDNAYWSAGKRYCITCWAARTGRTLKPRVAS